MNSPDPRQPADPYARQYFQERLAYWQHAAGRKDQSRSWGGYYHHRLSDIYCGLVSPGLRVIELGCGEGDLLAAVKPSYGVGVDFSPEVICRARARHPELCFIQADVHDLALNETFDIIILSDLLSDVWDVQTVLEMAASLSNPGSRIILNSYSRLWEIPLMVAQRLGLAQPVLQRNWLTVEDVANLESLADLEVIRS
jgi:ubiquinone/menaquinone biosynthesis C-methylase UbiE